MGTWLIVLGAVALNLWLGYNYAKSKLPYKIQQSKKEFNKRWSRLDWEVHGKEDVVFWFGLTTVFPFFMIPLDLFRDHIKRTIDDGS